MEVKICNCCGRQINECESFLHLKLVEKEDENFRRYFKPEIINTGDEPDMVVSLRAGANPKPGKDSQFMNTPFGLMKMPPEADNGDVCWGVHF